MPPTLKLLGYQDQYCVRDALHFIAEIGHEAESALPEIETKLNKSDLRENYSVFEALEKIGTPEALALIQKNAALNPKATENLPKLYDMIDSLNRYFSFAPEFKESELHIISVDETPANVQGNQTGEVKIVVDYPNTPIFLSLSGGLPIRWSLDLRNGSKVIGILFTGSKVQVVGEIPSEIPVGGFVNNPRFYEYQLHGGEYPITRIVGKKASTVQKISNTDNVILNSATKLTAPPKGD